MLEVVVDMRITSINGLINSSHMSLYMIDCFFYVCVGDYNASAASSLVRVNDSCIGRSASSLKRTLVP